MANDILLVGWNRAVAGREADAIELFGTVMGFYEAQKRAGHITHFENYFLQPHGGDLNGFTLLHGEHAKLSAMVGTDEWLAIETKAIVLLQGFGVIRGVTGDQIQKVMGLYMNSIPKR
jgi:hypothetical protein